jgi:hypothetical protein
MHSLALLLVALTAIPLLPSPSGAQERPSSSVAVAVRVFATHSTGFAFSYLAPGSGQGRLSDACGGGVQLLVRSPWLLAPYVDYRVLSATLQARSAVEDRTTRLTYSSLAFGIQLPVPLFKPFTATAIAHLERTIGNDVPTYTTAAVGLALDADLTTHLAIHGQITFAHAVATADWRRTGVLLLGDPKFRRELLGLTWWL